MGSKAGSRRVLGAKRKPRSQLQDIVTEARIEKLASSLRGYFAAIDKGSSAPADHNEARWREKVVNAALREFLLGTAVYLQFSHSEVFHALLTSAARWCRQWLDGEVTPFTAKFPKAAERFWDRAQATLVLGLHKFLSAELRRAFRNTSLDPVGVPFSHFTSKRGRYSNKQRLGTRRFHHRRKQRAEIITRILSADLITDQQLLGNVREITLETALGWIQQTESPAALSRLVIGHLLGLKERTVKELLRLGRRQDREGREYLENASSRQPGAGGPT